MEPILTFDQVSFQYTKDSSWALKNIDFSLFPGEWVTVLGGNGSGKSTMAKLMNGLLVPSEGKVMVFGNDTSDPNQLWEIRKQIGMIFQNPENQIVAMTVADDIAFGLENLGLPPVEIEERIERVLAQLKLTPYKDQEPHTLSGGQKQRLAIAGVLAMEPKVIIFDEATSMLDPQGAQDVFETIVDLHKQGISIIHITHEMEEIIGSDRVLVLKHGEILLSGTPREVLTVPDLLKASGLVAPFAVRVRESLRKHGCNVKGDIISVQELLEGI